MGIQSIIMPQLGESVTEGTIEKWLVKPGDIVQKYDSIAEVNTDKVTADLPSSFSGTIQELVVNEGDTVTVGEIVCKITTADVPIEIKQADSPSENGQKMRYSPAVLKLANEHQINLSQIQGTGAQGRITRKDVQQFIDNGVVVTSAQSLATPLSKKTPLTAKHSSSSHESIPSNTNSTLGTVNIGDIEIPMTPVRRTIAANMIRSKQEAPHAWMMIEADVTNLVEFRDSLKADFKKREGYNLTYFAFFVKTVAQALKEFPMMNAMWAGDKIIQKKEINLSIAVATEDALFVPVIHNADDKSIKGIAKEIHELALKVRAGKLQSADIQGGTFTINNTGTFGSVQSMGIINYPQAAIMQIESIVKRPVILKDGMFAARSMVNLCLSLDHRVLDGLICGKFLSTVKDTLENISKEHTSIY